MKHNTSNLLRHFAALETAAYGREFIAPVTKGGCVQIRIDGIVSRYRVTPPNYEGIGVFRGTPRGTARHLRDADPIEAAEYFECLPKVRVRLAAQISGGSTWVAIPASFEAARARLSIETRTVVRLVQGVSQFDAVVARYDGSAFWFGGRDHRADPETATLLARRLATKCAPTAMRLKRLTPEDRLAYEVAFALARRTWPEFTDRGRLIRALESAGGRLTNVSDHDDYWVVDWLTPDGRQQRSAVEKRDLTIMSAGLCLDGEDRKFDLQSLVGVVEGAW